MAFDDVKGSKDTELPSRVCAFVLVFFASNDDNTKSNKEKERC
jgi:hypothetical protein